MKYWINRAGKDFGPYTRIELISYIEFGSLLLSDDACEVGSNQWKKVSDFLPTHSFSDHQKSSTTVKNVQIERNNISKITDQKKEKKPKVTKIRKNKKSNVGSIITLLLFITYYIGVAVMFDQNAVDADSKEDAGKATLIVLLFPWFMLFVVWPFARQKHRAEEILKVRAYRQREQILNSIDDRE